MTTKKEKYKIVIKCASEEGTFEAFTDQNTKKQHALKCPACEMKLILLLPELELRAHGKSAETIGHELLMVQEL